MAEKKIPRSKWITEQPFDVAEWGDKEGSYRGGGSVFESDADFEQAKRDSVKLPKSEPLIKSF